jgi:LysM repeat protein
MPEDRRRRSPFRLLAPLALLLCAAAIAAVVLSSNVVDSGNGNEAASSATETAPSDQTTTERKRPRRRVYTVKLNDSLGSIAEKTGVPVERLEELNPELDPQALVVGQKIKLRE